MNPRPIALFLFDVTGVMAEPWAAAGYECWCVDIQRAPGIHRDGNIVGVGCDIRQWLPPRRDYVFGCSFVPCTDQAVSGARWFQDKGLAGLAGAVELVERSRDILEWIDAPWIIENPVSTMASYWRPPDHIFNPHNFTFFEPADNYTKKTCLWSGGGFVMPEPCPDLTLGDPDDRIHKAPPGPERANFRSATPRGFSRAVFEANAPCRKAAAA